VGTATVVLVVAGLAPARGEAGESTGAASQKTAAAAFSNGVAHATAVVSRVAPGVGSLALALASGIAVSELKNTLAQAQAQSLDLGLIGTTLTAEGCTGGAAAVTPDQLPQPTRVDNRQGDAQATTDEAPVADSALGFGREFAKASKTPMAAEAVATSAASFGPVVNLSGGRADARTEVIDGAARQAHATVEATLSIAGVVELSGMRWDAVHRTGADPHASASFDPGTAKVLGLPVPVDSLVTLETLLNQALAPSGITVTFPKVERFKEPADLVRITPMRIVLKDSPAGKTALGPGLDLTRAQRGQLFDTIAGSFCQAAGALLVGDIGVSIASGSGFLAMEIGGAEAQSGDLVLENPFGSLIAPSTTGAPVLGTPLTGGTAPAVATPAAGPSAPVGAAAPQRTASIGPLRSICETIHPRHSPDCSRGALLPLGVAGLLATAGVAALDWRHQRRRLATAGSTGPTAVGGTA
jgi:hypothetical protein